MKKQVNYSDPILYMTPKQVLALELAATTAENKRIVKLLEDDIFHYLIGAEVIVLKGQPLEYPVQWVHADSCAGCLAIYRVKGEE